MSPSSRRPWSWVLAAHAAVVVLLTGLYVLVLLTTGPEEGVNFGIVFVLLPMAALGLPWSVPMLVGDPYRFDGLSDVESAALSLGPGYLNLVLHALVFLVAGRLSNPQGSTSQKSM
jgi:hypothetical protein